MSHQPVLRQPALPVPAPAVGRRAWPARWRLAWEHSLRFRLLALGLMPLLLAFPALIAVLVVVGGERADRLMEANLRSNMASSRNYLEQLRKETTVRVHQLATSERLMGLVNPRTANRELNQALAVSARSSGLDYLIVAASDGRIIGSSNGVTAGTQLPHSHVIRQARTGVNQGGFELFAAAELPAFGPALAGQARILPAADATPTPGLLINAAAHFPLAVNSPDAILVGGVLLNRNEALIEHMREVIYPLGTLPGDAEGITTLYIGDLAVAISRQRQLGQRQLGSRAPAEVSTSVLRRDRPWLGKLDVGGDSFMSGFEPIEDGEGHRIGMIGVSFPAAPYQQAALLLLAIVAGLLALTMLAISIVFLRTGRELAQRLDHIGQTMNAVSQGDRLARVGRPLHEDELGGLARHFNRLLDTIAEQDARQREAQQKIADEASRRRTLFEKVNDGIAILNPDGTVFEANPKFAALLGCSQREARQLRPDDWEAQRTLQQLQPLLADTSEARTLETQIRRKDGSCFDAEVSLSRTEWAGHLFTFLLVRDISRRKAAEAELQQYRRSLEALVEQRTRELNDRSEQLAAIFSLSPDGFVSFDRQGGVNHANEAFLRMTGLDGAEILGRDEASFSSLLRERCRAGAMFAGVANLRGERGQSPAGETGEPGRQRHRFELAQPAGRVLEVDLRLAEGDASVSQILYFRDITHETEVDRMKSEFLSTAAHELRTPMASIYGYTELLRAREFDTTRRQQILETISRQSQLMSSIINELLDLARIEARRGQDFVIERQPLQALVREVVAGYKPPAARQPPALTLPSQPLHINADRQKIQQALLNILSNAYKYSPQGGTVSIDLLVEGSPEAGRVGIRVGDHGIGMKPEQLARVFERFYRADDSGNIPGTGLGMSIVKEIIELHRGEVQLTSEFGQGTTVVLWLPLAEPAEAVVQ